VQTEWVIHVTVDATRGGTAPGWRHRGLRHVGRAPGSQSCNAQKLALVGEAGVLAPAVVQTENSPGILDAAKSRAERWGVLEFEQFELRLTVPVTLAHEWL